MNDPIVEEVHAARRKLLAECGGDLMQLMKRYREKEAQHPSRVVNLADVRHLAEERTWAGNSAPPPWPTTPN